MNIQLIQHNLKEVENQALLDNTAGAVMTAMAVVKLLLKDPIKADARSVYGAYGGMAVVLKNCYKTLLQSYNPGEDLKAIQEKIDKVNEQIADDAKKAESIKTANGELLAAEEKLRTQKKELEGLRDKVAEQVQIRDRELKELEAEIAEKKTKLAALEESCRQAKAEREKWLLVFDENNRLIADLPDSVADRTADALIAKAKAYRDQAQANAEEGEEYLIKVIEALEAVKQKMGEPN